MRIILRLVLIAIAGVVILFGAIQLIPVDRENPPVVTHVQWDSQETHALFTRACADCHSNETVWPAYAYVAPMSWLVAYDVEEGREEFNISDLGGGEDREKDDEEGEDREEENELVEEVREVLDEGEMPLRNYLMLHPEAKLSEAERRALADGLEATLNAALHGQ